MWGDIRLPEVTCNGFCLLSTGERCIFLATVKCNTDSLKLKYGACRSIQSHHMKWPQFERIINKPQIPLLFSHCSRCWMDMNCYSAYIHVVVKGRHGDSLSLFIDIKQRVTKPSRSIRCTVGDHCSNFMILTWHSLYINIHTFQK